MQNQQQTFEVAPEQQVQYVMQAPMPQGVVYAQAPQPVAYASTQPMQYTYMAPPAGQQVVLQDGQQVYVEGMDAQQVGFVGAPMVAAGPARMNISPELFAKLAAGGQMTPEEMAELSGQPAPGQVEAGQPALVQQPTPGGSVAVQQQPASPMKQPTPGSAGAAGAAPGSAKASGKKEKKDKSGSKKSLKASKKKKSKGC